MSGTRIGPDVTAVTFPTLGAGATSVAWENARASSASVTLGGTFGGATVVIEGSDVAGGPYATLTGASGLASYTAAAVAQIRFMPRFWRVRAIGGTGTAVTATATVSATVGNGSAATDTDAEASALAAAASASAAAASASDAEAAFAVASLGFAGPLITAGGYHLTTVLYRESGQIVAGFDVLGRFLAWDGTAFGPVGSLTVPQITNALGYTPANAANVTTFQGPLVSAGGYHFINVFYDSALKVLGGIDVLGRLVWWDGVALSVVGSGSSSTANPAPVYSYDTNSGGLLTTDDTVIYGIIGWGQSLAFAGIGAVPGDVPISTTALHPGWSLMPGTTPFPEGATLASFTDLRNVTTPRAVETAGPTMFDVIQTQLNARFGRKQRMVWSVAAAGGALYSTIKRGTSVYAELLRIVERSAALARAEARRLVVPGIWVRHGEADVNRHPEAYAADLMQFRRDLDEDIRAITGQREAVRLFLTQPTRGSASSAIDPGTPTGMMLAAARDPYCRMMGPIYYAIHDAADTAHPTAAGYYQIGRTQGHAISEELFGPGFTATSIQAATWVTGGSTPVLELRYTRPVVIDSSGAAVSPTGLAAAGFDFLDGASVITISSVASTTPALVLSISGNQITFTNAGGTATDTFTVRTNGDAGPVGVTVTVDGTRYDVLGDIGDFLTEVAEKLRVAIPGATRSGRVVTVSGATTITGSVATSFIRLTLASAPTLNPTLLYAVRATGSGAGTPNGARGLVREWRRLEISPVASWPLHHWACVEVRTLPRI